MAGYTCFGNEYRAILWMWSDTAISFIICWHIPIRLRNLSMCLRWQLIVCYQSDPDRSCLLLFSTMQYLLAVTTDCIIFQNTIFYSLLRFIVFNIRSVWIYSTLSFDDGFEFQKYGNHQAEYLVLSSITQTVSRVRCVIPLWKNMRAYIKTYAAVGRHTCEL